MNSSSSGGFTVVVVDDAEDCVATLEMALGALPGVQVWGVRSAEEALAILNSRAVDGVITDLQLPAMTGLELISRIRENPAWRAMPIVVISAATDPAAPGVALQRGANAFFGKPFSPSAVRNKLEELMHERSTA
jgi:CheY-like chemotaxis protein